MAETTQNGADRTSDEGIVPNTGGRVAPDWLRRQIRQLKARGGGGNTDYIDAKWGLAWLRWEDPQAVIETRMLHFEGDEAVFSTTITLSTGGSATGHGSETKKDFTDFLEKSETKSVRRALNHLGYSIELYDAFTGETGGGDGQQRGTTVASSRQEQEAPPVTGDAREQGSYAWVMAEIAAGAADGEKFTSFYNTHIAKLPVKEEQNAARKAAQARRQ